MNVYIIKKIGLACMEGCTHLPNYKKYKKKLSKFINQEHENYCFLCRSDFQVHKCLDCGYTVCFDDIQTHTFHKKNLELKQKYISDDENENKMLDIQQTGEIKNNTPVLQTECEKTEIVKGFLTNNFEFVNKSSKVINEPEMEEIENEYDKKRMRISSENTEIYPQNNNLPENCNNLFFNINFNCIYCSECKKYLNFNKVIEMTQQKLFHIKNQKNFTKMAVYYIKGIINLGHTCYMNTIFQIFLNSKILKKRFCDTSHERVTCPNETCIICAMKNMYIDCYSALLPILTNDFLYAFFVNMKGKYKSEQFDAYEFFLDLCQILHEQFNNQSEDCNCLIHEIFEGSTISTLKCLNCDFTSTKLEKFNSLSLGTKNSVQNSFDFYFRDEEIPAQIFCQNCQKQETTKKKIELEKKPQILVLQLKRYLNNENILSKDTSIVEINRILNVHTATSQKKFYRLFGAICHTGKLNSGHYFSFVMRNNQWIKFDDEKVEICNFKDLSDSFPYIFFYQLE